MYSRTLVERASASSGRSRWVATVTSALASSAGSSDRGRRPANVTLRSARSCARASSSARSAPSPAMTNSQPVAAFLELSGGVDQRAHGMAHADGARVDDPPSRGTLVAGEHEAPRVDAVGDDDDPLGGMAALAQDALETGRGDRDQVGVAVGEALEGTGGGDDAPRGCHRPELDRRVGPQIGDVEHDRSALDGPDGHAGDGREERRGLDDRSRRRGPSSPRPEATRARTRVWLSRRRPTPRLGAG